MNNIGLRFPAEWESVGAVVVAWPHEATDWSYMLDEIRECYAGLIAALSRHVRVIIIGPEAPDHYWLKDCVNSNIQFVRVDTNDTWVRDYGPLTLVASDGSRHYVDYKFNGWGLKFAADKDNLATSFLCREGILEGERLNRLSFVMEGGSIETDGNGLAMVTADCLLSPNRNGGMDRGEIEAQLKSDLHLDTLVWLHNGALEGDDTDGHIDTLVRLAPPGNILFHSTCEDIADSHYDCLQKLSDELAALRRPDGSAYRLVSLPIPPAIFDPEDGSRLPATYANFLFVNGVVLMPVYGCPDSDAYALRAVREALPGYTVEPVDCRALIRQHGSLHCATMQIPVKIL